ncbi:Protein phosphatase 1L [Lobosporangium transversale]|uniref:PPM-type phosphatase domain-containing protein n=1 Tax=Lobosporangium transversale TaxID=64571 RepID=A0A1Y2GSW0_9FUNG|nr:hypothetical protein BCR41DRAFT_395082 [Lobosporangium transversale]KAF9918527.1 Protein phosphatase 1L [Lobosporangium transversale]ORZ20068.1 hypothetical protein BCR41DRAFT_395082 [Lobosporangium transversale]|eukprot:XP_021882608.1 hypothetical protein BCR41DRAFT_395082 [Lobosporangium transversale]
MGSVVHATTSTHPSLLYAPISNNSSESDSGEHDVETATQKPKTTKLAPTTVTTTTSTILGTAASAQSKGHLEDYSNPATVAPEEEIKNTTGLQTFEGKSTSSSSSKRGRKPKARPPSQLGGSLPKLSKKAKLPKLTAFHLSPEQLKHPLFLAIARVLVARGNHWQSATDLVEGIRYYKLASLGGQTPRGTVQGAISTALTTAHNLGTFEPIEKKKMSSTTYYRMAPSALDPSLHLNGNDSDATESDSNNSPPPVPLSKKPRKIKTEVTSRSRSSSKMTTVTSTSNAKRKTKEPTSNETSQGTSRNNKRKSVSGWSDTLSSDSSEDDTRPYTSRSRSNSKNHHNNHKQSLASSKRTRTGSPNITTSSRSKAPERKNSIPNGLKKLPKGYVYDTEINQAALMKLSINPSQTGEYMRHLKGKNAQENNFPDRRGEFGVDLTQEPSTFAIEQQTGYTYPRLRNSGRERLPKGDCEDGYAIADLKHKGGGFLGRLFCITDGHGGRACSSFVVATIPGALQVIFGKYKPTDLSQPSVQELIKNQITEAIRLIDKEYLEYKKQQYLRFKAKQIINDPGSDGTTLIVNIFIDKWLICLNLGDSRTMMGSRDSVGRWNVDFYSEDHTPSLERLAQTIYANGGEFVTHDDKIIKFDPNLKNDKKHRQSLKEARIRVKDGESNQYGIPFRTKNGHCASVNLGACIGDVLYKLDPVNPVLSCKPDITFIDITDIQQGFLLMASDGLWDYVQRGGKVQDQNATVCQFVGDKIDRGWNHQRIVYTLSDRENATGLYSESIQEYDDFTAILVTFSKQQLIYQQRKYQEEEDQELMLQKQRIQEKQILLMHQQQLKQREIERQQQLQQLKIQTEKAELEQLRREQELLRKAKKAQGETDSDSDMMGHEHEREHEHEHEHEHGAKSEACSNEIVSKISKKTKKPSDSVYNPTCATPPEPPMSEAVAAKQKEVLETSLQIVQSLASSSEV